MFARKPALFDFAWHHSYWLQDIATIARDEPWGTSYKVLDLYLKANFEIAQAQNKIFEDKDKNVAFWRAGSLVSQAADPIWLVYKTNSRDAQPWALWRAVEGSPPVDVSTEDYTIRYQPPEYNTTWMVSFDQRTLGHILRDTPNKSRLESIFNPILSNGFNESLIFKVLYGEVQLKHKEGVVIPQWYDGEYQFLMPLHLTQDRTVELTAALHPNPALKRYEIRTLLFPSFSYAYARAVVRSRTNFADWMLLSENDLRHPEDDRGEESTEDREHSE
jgi:hypothetical protein